MIHINPSSQSLPLFSFSLHPPYPHPLLREGKASHGESTESNTLICGRSKAIPTISRPIKVALQREWVPKSQYKHRDKTCPTVSGPTVYPSHTTVTHRGPSLVLCWFLPCHVSVDELPYAQVSCFSGYTHHGPDFFAHILTPPTLLGDFGSSAQCFTVDLCLSFHQLLNEVSIVTFKIVIQGNAGMGCLG